MAHHADQQPRGDEGVHVLGAMAARRLHAPDQIDPTQRQTVELEWDAQRHGRLHLARELITNTDVAISARGGAGTGADSVVVQVPAGEVRVLSLE